MKTVSDESKLEQIYKLLAKIDVDKDGQIKIDDVLEVSIRIEFILKINKYRD